MDRSYFFKDKPLFGLDIGFSSVKVMQIADGASKTPRVTGYGVNRFDPRCIVDGVIVDMESMATSIKHLFEKQLVGSINTRRVAFSVPAVRTFEHMIKLPKLSGEDLAEAVRSESEQYIPVPLEDLYMDYTITASTDKELEILTVAAPRKIIDSYVALSKVLGLEIVAIEPTIASTTRLFICTDLSDIPTVLVDFGSVSSDITVFDKTMIVTGTSKGGGDDFTDHIAKKLNVSKQEAHIIKTKYGLSFSKKQKEIVDALTPTLEQLLKETRRMIRYYEERYGADNKIRQIVTMGGGANMPGLSDYMTNALRLPVRMSDPWHHVSFSKLQPPGEIERSMFVTAGGLALIRPGEIFS